MRRKRKEPQQLLLQMQLQNRRALLSHRWLSCSAEPVNTCPRFSQPLGFGGESWSQEAGLGSWLTAAHLCDLDSFHQAKPEFCSASAGIFSCSSARASLHGALQEPCQCCPCRWALSPALCSVPSLAHF